MKQTVEKPDNKFEHTLINTWHCAKELLYMYLIAYILNIVEIWIVR